MDQSYVTHHEFAAFVKSTDEKFNSIERMLSGISTDVKASSKTDWGVLAAWASVVLVAAGLVGGLVAYGLNGKIDNEIKRVDERAAINRAYIQESTMSVREGAAMRERVAAMEKFEEIMSKSGAP